MKKHLIANQLVTGQYYTDRLSMFMRGSYGITDNYSIVFSILHKIDFIFDTLFNALDIFNVDDDEDYDSNMTGKVDIIKRVAAIFNCYPVINIKNENNQNETITFALNTTQSCKEFMIYTKCQIIKQNFNGTRENLQKLYTTYEEGQLTSETKKPLLDLIFVYLNAENSGSADCDIIWLDGNTSSYSSNLRKLFKAGYLTIESMGINYNRKIGNILQLARFVDVSNIYNSYTYCQSTAPTITPGTEASHLREIWLKVVNNIPTNLYEYGITSRSPLSYGWLDIYFNQFTQTISSNEVGAIFA